MVWLLRRCVGCGRYTLKKDKCPYCGEDVCIPHPARFSPDDRYAKYKSVLRSMVNEENNNNRERGY